MQTKINYAFLLLVMCLFSCKREHNNHIDVAQIKSFFLSNTGNEIDNNSPSFKFNNDTVYLNKKINPVDHYLQPLVHECEKIDSQKYNIETKNYIKSLLLCEWLFGSFNIQFLGPQIGQADTSTYNIDFFKTQIESCYKAGNSNQIAIWCGERTAVFTRVLDSLFQIKSKIIYNSPTHVFPIVQIGEKWYIIDPYDPFILFNHTQSEIIDYYMLKQKHHEIKTIALRTKRNFGTTGELVSKKFYNQLQLSYPKYKNDIASLIKLFLDKNKTQLSMHIDSCTFENSYSQCIITPVKSENNVFIVNTKSDIVIKQSRILKYYLNIDCKIK